MMKCTPTQQVRAFFGIGLVMLSLQAFAAAAPLCGGVFNSQASLSQKEIDSKITEIAKLKLEIDSSMSTGGEQKLGEKTVRNNFNLVLESVVRDLKDHKSEKEIRELIKTKIAELQGRQDVEKKTEQTVRERDSHILADTTGNFTRKYKVQESIPLKIRPASNNRLFEAISHLNLLVVETLGKKVFNLSIVDLKTKKQTTPVKGIVAATVFKNRDLVYALKPTGELLRYNLISKVTETVMQTGLLGPEVFEVGTIQPKMDVDSSGQLIVIKMRQSVHLINLMNHEITSVGHDVNFAKFVNESIVTAPSSGGYIYRYSVANGKLGKEEYFEEYVDGIFDVFPAHDSTHSVLWGFKTVHAAPEKNYSDLLKYSLRFDDMDPSAAIHKLKSIGDGNAFYIKHTDEVGTYHDVYLFDEVKGFILAATLTNFKNSAGVEHITATQSGDRIFTTHQDGDVLYLDNWSE